MKKDTFIIVLILIFIAVITSFGILSYSFDTFFMVVKPIMMMLLLAITFLFFRKCFKWYASYMMTDKSTFHAKVDRPRIFIFSIFLPILFIIFYSITSLKSNEAQTEGSANLIFYILSCAILISLFAIVFMLLVKTLSKSFEKLYLQKVQKVVKESIGDFKTKLLPTNLSIIFDRLLEYDFLSYEDLEEQKKMKEKFIDIFSSGIYPNEPFLKLNMDNIQTHVLYQKFKGVGISITLTGMTKIFMNENGKVTAKSISNSYNQRSVDKAKDESQIIELFKHN